MNFSSAAIIIAYEKGMRDARAGYLHCPFDEPEDWRRASAWHQGYKDMCQMMDDARDLGDD